MYVGRISGDSIQSTTQVNGGGLSTSRLGFKGSEDLGNGLKALFQYETAINIDQQSVAAGNSGLFGANRTSMVGLSGNFGTVVAGRLQTTGYDWAVKYDVLAGTAISPLQNVNTTNAATRPFANSASGFLIGGTAVAARADNAVAYISPNMSGVTLAANYTTNVVGADTVDLNGANRTNSGAYLLSANYENGPLAAGVVYAQNNNTNAAVVGLPKRKDWSIGANYNFGVAKVFGTYQTTKATGDGVVGVAGNTDKAWSLGVAAPVTAAGTVIASYAKGSYDTVAAPTGGLDVAKSWTVAYTHGLSKRTTAYAGYMNSKTDAANSSVNAMVAGLRHSF